MLAPNWEDHNLETNPIINLFADRNHTEMVFKNVENKVKKRCFYCQKCKNCKTFQEYLKVFKQKGSESVIFFLTQSEAVFILLFSESIKGCNPLGGGGEVISNKKLNQ